MRSLPLPHTLLLVIATALAFFSPAQAAEIVALRSGSAGERLEFRLTGVPDAANPFDPDVIRVDAEITAPSGARTTVPAFWFQDYSRRLEAGAEVLSPAGSPEWRLRFTSLESGKHRVELLVSERGSAPRKLATTNVDVAPSPNAAARGTVRIASDRRYFEKSDGSALRLIGENVCWPQSRGTFDYEEWFTEMQRSGQNFARLWMAPWWAGIEHAPDSLTRYKLDAAWQLDRVFDLAEQHGLYLMLCFDHHGMYMANDPAWGGSNNFWTRSNPYSVENGGPCSSPNDFFTNPKAREIYQKRLRYLIARYGHNPLLHSWQFFNEIDNSYLPRSNLVAADVAAWHRDMARWLRANDPYRRLITTSLTGGSDRPEIWEIPEIEFSMYHSYADPSPGKKIAQLSEDFVQRYGKPVMIGEFGVLGANWARPLDPHLRGLRQALWGGALGGSVGTSMTWWWEDVHEDRAYSLISALSRVLKDAGWHDGTWTPLTLPSSTPPLKLGATIREAETFNASVALNTFRRILLSGEAAIANPLSAERASEALSGFLRGANTPAEQRRPFRLLARFGEGARLVYRVESVGGPVSIVVRAGERELHREQIDAPSVNVNTTAPKLNREVSVALPAGEQHIEILNTGDGWAVIDSLRLEKVRYSEFAGGWEFPPESVGLRQGKKAILYVNSPWMVHPAGAIRYDGPLLRGQSVPLRDWPAGEYRIAAFDPRTGERLHETTASTTRSTLTVPLPDFSDDLAIVVTPLAR